MSNLTKFVINVILLATALIFALLGMYVFVGVFSFLARILIWVAKIIVVAVIVSIVFNVVKSLMGK